MPSSNRNHTTVWLGVFCLLLGNAAMAAVPATTPNWKAGFARAKITPSHPVMLGGYASRNEPFRHVDEDIFVKAMALEDAQGSRAVLLTIDLVGFRAMLAAPTIARIADATGLERERVLLNFSHNHTGPSATATAGAFLDASQTEQLESYHSWLQRQITDAAVAALQDLSPAELSFGSGMALFAVNRREPTPQGIKLGFNPRGVADRTVPVLRITSPDGRLRAIVFGAACHPTTIPARENAVNGDFPGYAQAQLEAAHAGAQAMFVQGFAGATGPYPTGNVQHARQHGLTLAKEVERVLAETTLTPLRGPLRIAQGRIRLPLDPPTSLAEVETLARSPQQWQKFAASRMLVRWHEGIRPQTEYETPIGVWQFGSDLTLLALPGEVVAEYALRFTEAIGPLRLWMAGYSNDVFGYLPTAQILREGGYETRGLYSGERFSPEVENVVVEAVVEIAAKAGRPSIELPAP